MGNNKNPIYLILVIITITAIISCAFLFVGNRNLKFENKSLSDLLLNSEQKAKKQLMLAQTNQAKADKLLSDIIDMQNKVFKLVKMVGRRPYPKSEVTREMANMYNDMAWLQIMNKQYDQAIESSQKALEVSPHFYDSYRNIAIANLLNNNFDKAKEIYMQIKDHEDGKTTYKEIFFGDLMTLENEGFRNENIDKFYKFLNEN